jgi:hypothetical protein
VLENDERVDVHVARAVTAQTGEIVEFATLWTRRQTTELADGVRVNIPTIDDLIPDEAIRASAQGCRGH